MSDHGSGPRLFGIVASAAPVVAVIRRGPSDWCHVSRWDLAASVVDHGSWFRGTIAPQKCDLSADGTWLAYSAVKYPGTWEAGAVHEAVSRLPWLTALAAWEAGTTYTRGMHFVDEVGCNDLGVPDVGDIEPFLRHGGVALTRADQFAVERRRGWRESEGTPARDSGGPWDENRLVEMTKNSPVDPDTALHVHGGYAAFRSMPDWHDGVHYQFRRFGRVTELADAQWADWDAEGRLLVATSQGRLQVRDPSDGSILFEHDLAALEPDPRAPPAIASNW